MKFVRYIICFAITVILLLVTYHNSPSDGIITLVPATQESPLQKISLYFGDDNSKIMDFLDPNKTCVEKHKHLVFVKTHKTGTSTTVNILYHFGITHGLNYAIYPYSHQLHIIRPDRFVTFFSVHSARKHTYFCKIRDNLYIESLWRSFVYDAV